MTAEPKACARPGCTGEVAYRRPYQFQHQRYCSRRCGSLANPESTARGGRMGGAAAAQTKRKAAIQRAASECARFLTPDIEMALGQRQLARVTVLFARAYRKGYLRGRQSGWLGRTASSRRAA